MFDFKQFSINDTACAMKVGTDSVLLGAWTALDDATHILDAGTGSGLLALMLAQRLAHNGTDFTVDAVEIDPDAAQAAAGNFSASPWAGSLRAVCADVYTFTPSVPPHLIISNPPYFAADLKAPDAARATARQGSGFSPVTLVRLAPRLLSPHGSLAMVTPAADTDDILFEARLARLHLRRLCHVATKAGKPPTRLLWQFSMQAGPLDTTHLDIRDTDGAYTTAYRNLTAPFYLHLK